MNMNKLKTSQIMLIVPWGLLDHLNTKLGMIGLAVQFTGLAMLIFYTRHPKPRK